MIEPCPVEFGYLYPTNYEDNHKQWILGFVCHQKEPTSNIHNHPVHAATKMCSKVKECIAEATSVNPTIILLSLPTLLRERVFHLFQVQ